MKFTRERKYFDFRRKQKENDKKEKKKMKHVKEKIQNKKENKFLLVFYPKTWKKEEEIMIFYSFPSLSLISKQSLNISLI